MHAPERAVEEFSVFVELIKTLRQKEIQDIGGIPKLFCRRKRMKQVAYGVKTSPLNSQRQRLQDNRKKLQDSNRGTGHHRKADGETLVFVEVKTRSSNAFGDLEAVGSRKTQTEKPRSVLS